MKFKSILVSITVLLAIGAATWFYLKPEKPQKPVVQNVVSNAYYVYLLALKDASLRYKDASYDRWIVIKTTQLKIDHTQIKYYTPAKNDPRYREFKRYTQLLSPQYYSDVKQTSLNFSLQHKPKLTSQLLQHNLEINALALLQRDSESLESEELSYLLYIYPEFDVKQLLKDKEGYIKKVRPRISL